MAMRIIVFLIFALAIPFSVSAQKGVVVSYDGYAGFQGPLWAPPREPGGPDHEAEIPCF